MLLRQFDSLEQRKTESTSKKMSKAAFSDRYKILSSLYNYLMLVDVSNTTNVSKETETLNLLWQESDVLVVCCIYISHVLFMIKV